MKTHKELNTSINNAIAGLTGHLASGVFYPLELIKIRLQVNEEKKVKILKLSKEIYHKEGLRGFFRGFYFSILAGGMANFLFFYK